MAPGQRIATVLTVAILVLYSALWAVKIAIGSSRKAPSSKQGLKRRNWAPPRTDVGSEQVSTYLSESGSIWRYILRDPSSWACVLLAALSSLPAFIGQSRLWLLLPLPSLGATLIAGWAWWRIGRRYFAFLGVAAAELVPALHQTPITPGRDESYRATRGDDEARSTQPSPVVGGSV